MNALINLDEYTLPRHPAKYTDALFACVCGDAPGVKKYTDVDS